MTDVLDDLDLSPWAHGGHVNYDRGVDHIGLAFWPAIDEVVWRGKVTRHPRPVACNVTAPIGGGRMTTDAGYLREQAARLAAAADLLDALQAAHPPHRSTLTLTTQEDTTP